VKRAKALFAKEYEKAAIAAALAPEVRRRRDISSLMLKEAPGSTVHLRNAMQYPWPVISYASDNSWMSGHYWPSHFAEAAGVHGAPPVSVVSY
jgi:hypothetical protein